MTEVDLETIPYILKRQVREMKRYRSSVPFHTDRHCEDKSRCAFHRRSK